MTQHLVDSPTTYVELRPHNARPVRVRVDGEWWLGALEAFRRERDGTWRGCVQWSEGLARTRIGWFVWSDLQLPPMTSQR